MKAGSLLLTCLYQVSPMGEVFLLYVCILIFLFILISKDDTLNGKPAVLVVFPFIYRKSLISASYFKSRIKR